MLFGTICYYFYMFNVICINKDRKAFGEIKIKENSRLLQRNEAMFQKGIPYPELGQSLCTLALT